MQTARTRLAAHDSDVSNETSHSHARSSDKRALSFNDSLEASHLTEKSCLIKPDEDPFHSSDTESLNSDELCQNIDDDPMNCRIMYQLAHGDESAMSDDEDIAAHPIGSIFANDPELCQAASILVNQPEISETPAS